MLHDDYKNIYNFMVFMTNNEGKRSVLELRANPVQLNSVSRMHLYYLPSTKEGCFFRLYLCT